MSTNNTKKRNPGFCHNTFICTEKGKKVFMLEDRKAQDLWERANKCAMSCRKQNMPGYSMLFSELAQKIREQAIQIENLKRKLNRKV